MIWIADLALIVTIAVVYRPALLGPFLFDDLEVWTKGPNRYLADVKPPHPLRLLVAQFIDHIQRVMRDRSLKPLVSLVWRARPLTWLTYNWDAYRHGLNARGWHRTSIGLHMVSAIAALHLMTHWFPLAVAIPAAFIYACHPLATMSVAYLSGRSSLLVAMFTILALLAAVSHQWALVAVLASAAILSKAEGIMALIFIGGLAWLRMI